jgi:hypothetical protein
MQAADLDNVDAECLEPGQQTLQRREIGYLAGQQCLDGYHRSGEIFEIEQGLRRKNSGDPDLISG